VHWLKAALEITQAKWLNRADFRILVCQAKTVPDPVRETGLSNSARDLPGERNPCQFGLKHHQIYHGATTEVIIAVIQ
jgi:hypothetical protein